MSTPSNDYIFEEGFKIIETNKNKTINLRQTLSNNNHINDNLVNLQILQYLGEFEFDLEALKSLLKDLKYSYNNNNNNKISIDSNYYSPKQKIKNCTYEASYIEPQKHYKEKTFTNGFTFSPCSCCYIGRNYNNNVYDLNKEKKLTYESIYNENAPNEKNLYKNNINNKHLYNDIMSDGDTDITLNFDYDSYIKDNPNKNNYNLDIANLSNYSNNNNNASRNKRNSYENNLNDSKKNLENNNNDYLSKSFNNLGYRFNEINNNNFDKNNQNFMVTPQFGGINGYKAKINNSNDKAKRIQKIIDVAFSDPNILDELKKQFGNDIGKKLLNGDISDDLLEKMENVLDKLNKLYPYRGDQKKLSEDKKIKYNNIKCRKFNQPRDKRLLREMIKSKQYNFREFPRGWDSTKEYFVNNGSTSIKQNNKSKNKNK